MPKPLKTFICYAREDRDAVDDLRKHLKQAEKKQLLEIWDDGEILAGQDWDKAIKVRLEKAQLILLFISIDFINSDYIETTELQAALQRHRDGEATLIPIIVRRCDWQEHFGIGQFQALPKEARPIKSVELSIREEIYYEVAQGIKAVAQEMQAKLEAERTAAVAAEEAAKRQHEKEAQARAERQRIKDEAAWKAAVGLDSLEAYEDYLEKGYTLHIAEAHERIGMLEEVEAKRRATQRAKEKAESGHKTKEAKKLTSEKAKGKREEESAYTTTHSKINSANYFGTDFLKRSAEIESLIANGELKQSINRMMDLAHDFSPAHLDEVVLLAAHFAEINNEERRGGIAFDEGSRRRMKIIGGLLSLLKEVKNDFII